MDLCPSPEHPQVVPDERGRKLRHMLNLMYYGEMGVILIRFFALGPSAGFF